MNCISVHCIPIRLLLQILVWSCSAKEFSLAELLHYKIPKPRTTSCIALYFGIRKHLKCLVVWFGYTDALDPPIDLLYGVIYVTQFRSSSKMSDIMHSLTYNKTSHSLTAGFSTRAQFYDKIFQWKMFLSSNWNTVRNCCFDQMNKTCNVFFRYFRNSEYVNLWTILIRKVPWFTKLNNNPKLVECSMPKRYYLVNSLS